MAEAHLENKSNLITIDKLTPTLQKQSQEVAFTVRRLSKEQAKISTINDDTKKQTAQTAFDAKKLALNTELDAVSAAVAGAIHGIEINTNEAIAAAAEMFMLQKGDTSNYHRNQAGWGIANALVIAGLFLSMGLGWITSPLYFAIALAFEAGQFSSLDLPSILKENQYHGKLKNKKTMLAMAIIPMILIIGAIGTALIDHTAAKPIHVATHLAAGVAGLAVGGLFFAALMLRFGFMVKAVHNMRKQVEKLDTQLVAIKDKMSGIAGALNHPGRNATTITELTKQYSDLRTTFVALRKERDSTASKMKTTLGQALLLLAVASVVLTLFVMPHIGVAVAVSLAITSKMLIAGGTTGLALALWTAIKYKFGFGIKDADKIDAEAKEAFGEKQEASTDPTAPATAIAFDTKNADKMVPKSPFWGLFTSKSKDDVPEVAAIDTGRAGEGSSARPTLINSKSETSKTTSRRRASSAPTIA